MVILRKAFWIAIGAAGAYLLDPDNGATRRAQLQEQIEGLLGHAEDVQQSAAAAATKAADTAKSAASDAAGAVKPDEGEGDSAPNDQELAHKVETEIFRDPDSPKGSVNVNAEVGIVYLRGEVESQEQISALVEAAGKVEGVRNVENLLHLPGEPAPKKEETEPETRRRVEGAAAQD